jgi:hypothetical protein
MDGWQPDFCFYDDPELPAGEDADKWSPQLRRTHQKLWTKRLPTGPTLELADDLSVTGPGPVAGRWLSSDTIATTHQRYQAIKTAGLWEQLATEAQTRYDRGFYRLGAFIVFPSHQQSINQGRGTNPRIRDRFDLTLECIRLHYAGIDSTHRNPLGDVLAGDDWFFALFGDGQPGFAAYVDFFHLVDLVYDGRILWFDEAKGDQWNFDDDPLPSTPQAYIRYLDNVFAFVTKRSHVIAHALNVS